VNSEKVDTVFKQLLAYNKEDPNGLPRFIEQPVYRTEKTLT